MWASQVKWRKVPVTKLPHMAPRLVYDLKQVQTFIQNDVMASVKYVFCVSSFKTQLTSSFTSIIESIKKGSVAPDGAIRVLLLHLKAERSSCLERQDKVILRRAISSLEQWLSDILEAGSHNFDVILEIA